jgi:hypothetical protein
MTGHEESSKNVTFDILQLMIDKTSQRLSISRDIAEQQALLVALRDALVDSTPNTKNDESSANEVLYALSDVTQEWSRHGVPVHLWRMWFVHGFSPRAAAHWIQLGVPLGYAVFYRESGLDEYMYERWVSFHQLGEFGDPATSENVVALIKTVQDIRGISVGVANKWVQKGISVWDMSVWVRAGYTPAKAQAAIKQGATVTQFSDDDYVPIPGASWGKIEKLANKFDWELKEITYGRFSRAKWEKKNIELDITFASSGRVHHFVAIRRKSGNRNITYPAAFHNRRGVTPLLKFLHDENINDVPWGE